MGNKICSCKICEDDKIEANLLSNGNTLKKEKKLDMNNINYGNLQKELISTKKNEKESYSTSRNRNSSNSTDVPDKNYLFNNHNNTFQSRNLKKEKYNENTNNNSNNNSNKIPLKETIKDINLHYENEMKEEIKKEEESPKNKSIISSLTSSKNQYGINSLKNSNQLNSHMNSDFSIYKVNGVQSNENFDNNNKKQMPLTCQDLLNVLNGNNKEDEKEEKSEEEENSNYSSKENKHKFSLGNDDEDF